MKSILLALVTLGFACGVTPIPDPPNLDPPVLDLVDTDMTASVLRLVGEPGAAEPGSTLRVFDLDVPVPAAETPVAADGSFAIMVPGGAPGHELRMILVAAERRSEPVDVLVTPIPSIVEVVRPLEDCLTLEPPRFLALDPTAVGVETTAEIALSNMCGAPVEIAGARLRIPVAGLSVDPGPRTIADGATERLTVRYTPAGAADAEEVVLFDVTAPEMERRPVSVLGRTATE